MLAIVDYGAGNLTSVARAFAHLDIPAKITADSSEIGAADGIIFPGVGHAGQAMDNLKKSGLDGTLAEAVRSGQPLLGICVGCQILLEKSAETSTPTLGLVQGECRRFERHLTEEDGSRINIPHMGWNRLNRKKDSPLLASIPEDAEFYFVHSYYCRPQEELIIATTDYGLEFCSVYGRDNLWATQFHPEKSGEAGLRLLANFNAWCNHAL